MTDFANVALMFGLGFATEVGYVGFVRATQALQPATAAMWCALLVALGWVAVYFMVTLTWFLALPALAGHSLGTYVAVSRARPVVHWGDGSVGRSPRGNKEA